MCSRGVVVLLAFVVAPVLISASLAEEAKNSPASTEAKPLNTEQLQGQWRFVAVERGGKKAANDRLKGKVVFTNDQLTLKSDDGDFVMKYELDASKQPATIRLTITASPFGGEGVSTDGIVRLKDNQLHLCYAEIGGAAPKEFASPEGKTDRYMVLERVDSK